MACLGGAVLSIILLLLVNLCGTLFVEAVNYKSSKYEILAIIKKILRKKRGISRIVILSDYYVFSEINKTRLIMSTSATAYYTINWFCERCRFGFDENTLKN